MNSKKSPPKIFAPSIAYSSTELVKKATFTGWVESTKISPRAQPCHWNVDQPYIFCRKSKSTSGKLKVTEVLDPTAVVSTSEALVEVHFTTPSRASELLKLALASPGRSEEKPP